jgi:flavin reductase (DIM6/NTAB) family NADH-FMN oxidoreductase RutF
MNMQPIDPLAFLVAPHRQWSTQWLLLCAGDFAAGEFNGMTVGWGSFGTMWGKPFAQVVVRPTRYTYTFLERFDSFTLTAFAPPCVEALKLFGSASGRDGDKFAKAGLTPTASTAVDAPSVAEAELVVECRKIYWQDVDPTHFLAHDTESFYPQKDYHRIYFGEILAIRGTAAYRT